MHGYLSQCRMPLTWLNALEFLGNPIAKHASGILADLDGSGEPLHTAIPKFESEHTPYGSVFDPVFSSTGNGGKEHMVKAVEVPMERRVFIPPPRNGPQLTPYET
ncbi:hypothetical protein BS47DRAFT_1046095 [Hydnum rufescens UP504]|uniref:Uncharacterized protein n=1 Tax=Hydnum rufescens UP504 TaxID=1448309 RepID=A0A9P6DVE2_9AGAM|nr:hypothetical protein BS47DRAFT_1046095 [Hydnum rufescens UP504]